MKVLIVGASFCGLACAKHLLDNQTKVKSKEGSASVEVVLVRKPCVRSAQSCDAVA